MVDELIASVEQEEKVGHFFIVLAMDFGIFGYHGTILESFQLFRRF